MNNKNLSKISFYLTILIIPLSFFVYWVMFFSPLLILFLIVDRSRKTYVKNYYFPLALVINILFVLFILLIYFHPGGDFVHVG